MEQGKKASISWWLLSNLPYNGGGLYKGIDVDPLGLFATFIVFKLKAGSNRKHCSKTISGLKSG